MTSRLFLLAIALIGCAAQTPTTQADMRFSVSRSNNNSFRVAKLYDKQKYYRAAVIYYNEVIRQQPGSEESKQAKKRIDQLRAQFGDAALQPAIPVSRVSKKVEAEQAAKARREAYVQTHPEYHKPRRLPSGSARVARQGRRACTRTLFYSLPYYRARRSCGHRAPLPCRQAPRTAGWGPQCLMTCARCEQ